MQKNIYKIIFLLVMIFLIISILRPIPARRAKIAYQKEQTKILEEKLKEEKKINEKLKQEIEDTKKISHIEKISRNNLKMSKDGEKLYKFIDDNDNKEENQEKDKNQEKNEDEKEIKKEKENK
ncbi:septum formation initiator family protein [Oceanivirga salmonicida]|uniref:septum formation initiator family protein n=1 Tax=Oceanivirga salmonicida TaxID=1769291 RepID=UPI00083324C6|nr:septum formation initiator family protein [Oceanivirga salmonicida]